MGLPFQLSLRDRPIQISGAFQDLAMQKLLSITVVVSAVFLFLVSFANAQTEVVTVQGNLPRFNYRDVQGSLLWSMPANSVLWKLDGPFNAGVVVCTAAARSGSIQINDGGVSIAGSGFPEAKLHIGTVDSPTEPGEVRFDPGNTGAATIHALNAAMSTSMILETTSPSSISSIQLKSTTARFTQSVGANFTLRDNVNFVNPIVIAPSANNNNALVIRNGKLGLGVTNPSTPLVLANGAKCSTGGVWTNASSRALKENVESLSLVQAREALAALRPVTYRYKAEPDEQQVGFIAEDVPELVATNSRDVLSPMDMVAVLTKVVQDQQSRLDSQAEQLDKQASLLNQQQILLEKLSNRLDQPRKSQSAE